MKGLHLINRKLLFTASDIPYDWADSYTQCPTVIETKDSLRVFFNTRKPRTSSDQYVSVITFADLELTPPHKVKSFSTSPVIEPGEKGTFDHFGVGVSSVLKLEGKTLLYYSGWQRQLDVPYSQSIGLAVSDLEQHSFSRYSSGPIIPVDHKDPFFVTTPSVIKTKDGFYAVYMSATKWIDYEGKMESIYTLKAAVSNDGVEWKKIDKKLLPDKYENECLAVPCIFFYGGLYHLLFSYRPGLDFRHNQENGYRIGYASSKDLIHWTRNDELIYADVSHKGWDSEMICYPNVCSFQDKLYMFYCGNYFGRDGIGMGELVFK